VAVALGRLGTDPGSLVAASSRGQVGGGARDAVPSGTVVTVDEGSWAPDGVGGGTIKVSLTVPGGSSTIYLAVMVREPDGWKVLATVPTVDKAPVPAESVPRR